MISAAEWRRSFFAPPMHLLLHRRAGGYCGWLLRRGADGSATAQLAGTCRLNRLAAVLLVFIFGMANFLFDLIDLLGVQAGSELPLVQRLVQRPVQRLVRRLRPVLSVAE